MRIRFTKMHGCGNDFVVLDETRESLALTAGQYRFLADRHLGIGADQILSVRPSHEAGIDFAYAIHNADGLEVEHCGNGARCFLQFVHRHGLTQQDRVRVRTMNRVIELHRAGDRVTVDMGAPVFDATEIPFDPAGMAAEPSGGWELWPLSFSATQAPPLSVAVLSMGNPHAVCIVNEVRSAPVAALGPLVERHPAFPRRVNAGFMEIVSRGHIRLRVYERGAGETLSCGTGACAAAVAGQRLGLLDPTVDVDTRGGTLTIAWEGDQSPVRMTGPATTVFEGEIELPEAP